MSSEARWEFVSYTPPTSRLPVPGGWIYRIERRVRDATLGAGPDGCRYDTRSDYVFVPAPETRRVE